MLWTTPVVEETTLLADRDQIKRFIDVVFRHADPDGAISIRAFLQKDQKSVFLRDAKVSDPNLVDIVCAAAVEAANHRLSAVFSPPIATFKGERLRGYLKATTANLRQGVTLSVELDDTPAASLRKLEAVIGPATLVVASGGQTESGEVKLHGHWVLKQPTNTKEDHERLAKARALACELVGADPS